jgi:ferredoxin-NADP reductase
MELMDRERVARDTMAFWLSTDGCQYEFRAGQNADFVLANPPAGSTDIARTFSLASSPRDRSSIMIAMRMRVSEFKTTLLAAPNGTRFEVSRARGSFTLHQDPQRPAVFLAGGIGITPMHSIIRWAGQGALPYRLFLFYSNRMVEDAAFLQNFEELARQNSRFRFIPTITNWVGPSWPYERGRIDAKMLTRHLAELKGPVYYLAGPSGMVTAMWDLIRSLGISEDDIKTEEFGEYCS